MHYGMPEKSANAAESTSPETMAADDVSQSVIRDNSISIEVYDLYPSGKMERVKNRMDEVLGANRATDLLDVAHLLLLKAKSHITPDTDWHAAVDEWTSRYLREKF
jgi:hypothetical protein